MVKTVVRVDRIEELSGILYTDKETDYLLPRSQIDRDRLYIHIGLERSIWRLVNLGTYDLYPDQIATVFGNYLRCTRYTDYRLVDFPERIGRISLWDLY